jgi:hypothetical protein
MEKLTLPYENNKWPPTSRALTIENKNLILKKNSPAQAYNGDPAIG